MVEHPTSIRTVVGSIPTSSIMPAPNVIGQRSSNDQCGGSIPSAGNFYRKISLNIISISSMLVVGLLTSHIPFTGAQRGGPLKHYCEQQQENEVKFVCLQKGKDLLLICLKDKEFCKCSYCPFCGFSAHPDEVSLEMAVACLEKANLVF